MIYERVHGKIYDVPARNLGTLLASSPGSPPPLFYSAHAKGNRCLSHAHYKKEEEESLGTRLVHFDARLTLTHAQPVCTRLYRPSDVTHVNGIAHVNLLT